MAHFAEIDDSNIVTMVYVVLNNEITDESGDEQESLGQTFFRNLHNDSKTYLKCSFNTYGNKYWSDIPNRVEGDQSKKLRGNFPGPGFTYDPENDVFYAPQPFNSWILNPTTYVWAAPIVQPTRNDDDDFDWTWDESVYQGDNSKGWVKVIEDSSSFS